MSRPNYVTDEHLIFLDELRESGVTNMFGASPYLVAEFQELRAAAAGKIVRYWMKTFGKTDR